VKAAEEGIKKRARFAKHAYHSQFRVGNRGEVVSFPRTVAVSYPYVPDRPFGRPRGLITQPDGSQPSPDVGLAITDGELDAVARDIVSGTGAKANVGRLKKRIMAGRGLCQDPVRALDDNAESDAEEESADEEPADNDHDDDSYPDPNARGQKRRRTLSDRALSPSAQHVTIDGSKKKCHCDSKPDSNGISRALRKKIERLDTVMYNAKARAVCGAALAELSVALMDGQFCCFNHLTLAADKVGFYKHNRKHAQLEGLIHKYAGLGHAVTDWLATEEAFMLVKPTARPENVFDKMKLANYMPDASQLERVTVTQERANAILDEVCPGMRAAWTKDGDVVTGVFRWLCDAGLVDGLREEYRMYKHHLRLPPSQSDLGWLRNAHHTVFQQLIRMDPLYYLLYVCLRPDHATSLLSYVYYAKLASPLREDPLHPGDVLPASKTFFRHIDLNMERVLEDDAAANIIQGSVSLTDEDEDNCTEVLPGLHDKFDAYWADLRKRGAPVSSGFVNAFTDEHFTDADKEKYQTNWRKDVCATGDARISSPLAPHGSTGPVCTTERMTALPWFVKIRADGVHLDMIDSGTADEVASAHRNLTHCVKSPSGKANIYGSPSQPFPAAIHLETKYHLPGAAVGRHSYDNWLVKKEQRVLFGTDSEARASLVRQIREDLGRNAHEALKLVKEAEVACFGNKSYFQTTNGNGGVAPPVDSIPAEKARVLADNAAEVEGDRVRAGIQDEIDNQDMSPAAGGMNASSATVLREQDKFHPLNVFAPARLWEGDRR
jgi:hypothetical protein